MERIHAIVEPDSQADPKFQTPLAFTRVTAKAVRAQLLAEAADTPQPMPAERTLHDLANDIAAVIRNAGNGGPAVIVGHAFGSWVARMTAVDHPELVRGAARFSDRHRLAEIRW